MPVEFSRISATKLDSLLRSQTVFFFAVGPLEDHGPHLPLGLDVEEASRLCRLAGEKLEKEMPGWNAVLMPAAPLGIQSDTTHAAIVVRPHVLRDWLVDACLSLKSLGFRHFVCFTGHLGPRQLTAVEEAGKMIARRNFFRPGARVALVSASSKLVTAKDVWRSLFWPDPTEHGGRRDTSVALAVCPESVDGSYRELAARPRPGSFFARAVLRFSRRLGGYWGAPAEASAEEGSKTIQGELDELFPKLRAVWEGSNANMIFRSWYSLLPPNKSFFRAWLIVFAFIILMIFWMAFTMNGVRY